MNPTDPKKIYAAISATMGEISAVGKTKKNAQQGYSYRGVDDVYLAVNAAMVKHGVFTVPKVLEMKREEKPTKSGGMLFTTVLTMEYTFFCVDGSSIQTVVVGEGMDSGDKASNKAMSVAHKYALIQIFAIPTEDPKDPEENSPTVITENTVMIASRENRKKYEGMLGKCTATPHIVELKKRVDASVKAGELTLYDSRALYSAIDKRSEELNRAPKEQAKQ